MAAAKKRGLGRGLDALLGGDGEGSPPALAQEGELRTLPLQQIQPGRYQPRRHWNEEALDDLAASIKAQGLIQPVVVREMGKHRYELIAGERRWRAAQRAQLGEIPALIKQVAEQGRSPFTRPRNARRESSEKRSSWARKSAESNSWPDRTVDTILFLVQRLEVFLHLPLEVARHLLPRDGFFHHLPVLAQH